MAPRPRVLSLCAGVGGLDLGLQLACDARTVGYVEREAFAAAVLVARMADAALDKAPVWDELASFDGHGWHGCVDIIAAGFPCQPHSVAGKRKGVDDARWLWPDIVRIVREVGPAFVFLENVPGLLSSGGFDGVLGDLAAGGFDAEWDVFSAAEIGAPHIRKRLFILAHADRDRRQGEWGSGILDGEQAQRRDVDRCITDVVDADRARLEGSGVRCGGRADERPAWPPGATDELGWQRVLGCWPELAPALEPGVRGVADGMAAGVDTDRIDRLRACGNGVVPQTAALAFRTLWARMSGKEG